MKHFFIITNKQKDEELKLTAQIQDYIVQKGGTCQFGMNRRTEDSEEIYNIVKEIPTETECVLCIGGDGTLIRAARDLRERNLPVIGINQGHVGYLCELDCNNVFSAIDQMMEDHYIVENRMMLSGFRGEQGTITEISTALNDIVIHRNGVLNIIQLVIYVNGEYLNTYTADGIIIATPTGSTAYSMSAGGPIVDPKAELIVITPVSPQTLNSKSIVLGAEDEITIELGTRRIEEDEEAVVCFDGDKILTMKVGDKIIVRKAKPRTRILKLNKLSFLETLRKKMQEYT